MNNTNPIKSAGAKLREIDNAIGHLCCDFDGMIRTGVDVDDCAEFTKNLPRVRKCQRVLIEMHAVLGSHSPISDLMDLLCGIEALDTKVDHLNYFLGEAGSKS